MHRSVLPYLWPITTGLLLAAVLLLASPEQLPNPFRQTPPAAVETPPALVPTTSNEQSTIIMHQLPASQRVAYHTHHSGIRLSYPTFTMVIANCGKLVA